MLPRGSVKWYSTQEVANIVGIHKTTLKRWLYSGEVAEPEHKKIALKEYRIWSEADLERVRKFKRANYRKKARRKKAGRTKASRSKS